ncbi:MAG: ATP-binding protein [Oscillospiraceae bacterium]
MEQLEKLVETLCTYPNETQWLEFKHNNYSPDMIGERISALANSAAFCDRDKAYMIWGVNDDTHEIVGTEFDQFSLKVGQQEIENWLRGNLSSNCEFEFNKITMNNKKIVVLIIYRATFQTVTFKKVDYIRVGSYTKKLMDVPPMKAQLWDKIRNKKFEDLYALKDLEASEALNKLDYNIYFELKNIPMPTNQDGLLHYMLEEDIISKLDNGLFAITNLGAILFAKKLSDFKSLSRKAIRIIQYKGNNKAVILKEMPGNKGYVVGFSGLMDFLEALLPSIEEIKRATRETKTAYPMVALREIIANALIHQDFSITGAGITIEIFDNRIEVINPGEPLIDISRIVDNPPRSRNEKLASLMRNLRMCEELGSGWDRIVISSEEEQISAPNMYVYDGSTKVTIFSEKSFSLISAEDKLWSCYLHSCINYVSGTPTTNSSLRKRFGLEEKSSATISRLIKDAIEKKYIKPLDPNTAPRHMQYIPIWA